MSIKDATVLSQTSTVKNSVSKTISNNIFVKTIQHLTRKRYKCYYGKSFEQLPNDEIVELRPEVLACLSGPDNGISDVVLVSHRTHLTTKAALLSTSQTVEIKSQNISDKLISNQLDSNDSNLINERWDSFTNCKITKWDRVHPSSFGIAESLYEKNLINKTLVGDPIADVFSVLTRPNSSILILADGVNWGPRSRLAARCAVRASMNYINKNLFCDNPKRLLTTHEVFTVMMGSFDAAQEFILEKKGTMTTLCCSVVLKLKDSTSSNPLWGVCTLSIGDSTAYVFNRDKGVLELTFGSRNINDDRDMRNVGGALGYVYGRKPDVSNLNYSFMYIKEGDMVFLVSDGISDNFDPCVSQTATRKLETPEASRAELPYSSNILHTSDCSKEENPGSSNSQSQVLFHRNSLVSFASGALNYTKFKSSSNHHHSSKAITEISIYSGEQKVGSSSLPELNSTERYLCGLSHMKEVLNSRDDSSEDKLTARRTCKLLVDHVIKVTAQKRGILENGLLEAASLEESEKAKFQASLKEQALRLRGKLDHASIVAFHVGIYN